MTDERRVRRVPARMPGPMSVSLKDPKTKETKGETFQSLSLFHVPIVSSNDHIFILPVRCTCRQCFSSFPERNAIHLWSSEHVASRKP